MEFDEIVKEIKRIHSISTNKDSDISLTYRGTSGGITKPFNIKIEAKEVNAKTSKDAALELYTLVKADLLEKISMMERQASSYKQALSLNNEKEN